MKNTKMKKTKAINTKAIVILLLFIFSSFIFSACKTFKKSNLENSNNEIIAAYALCIRSMSDATTEVSGKNVSFCNAFVDIIKNEKEYKICIDAEFIKKVCYKKIYNREGLP